jgi:hypothetical protein
MKSHRTSNLFRRDVYVYEVKDMDVMCGYKSGRLDVTCRYENLDVTRVGGKLEALGEMTCKYRKRKI